MTTPAHSFLTHGWATFSGTPTNLSILSILDSNVAQTQIKLRLWKISSFKRVRISNDRFDILLIEESLRWCWALCRGRWVGAIASALHSVHWVRLETQLRSSKIFLFWILYTVSGSKHFRLRSRRLRVRVPSRIPNSLPSSVLPRSWACRAYRAVRWFSSTLCAVRRTWHVGFDRKSWLFKKVCVPRAWTVYRELVRDESVTHLMNLLVDCSRDYLVGIISIGSIPYEQAFWLDQSERSQLAHKSLEECCYSSVITECCVSLSLSLSLRNCLTMSLSLSEIA